MKESGITFIALVITIIVLLILAGISIAMLMGENGILTNANYAKFATEVKSIEEQVELNQYLSENKTSGNINDILKINSHYNDKLYIENGKLVYIPDAISNQEKKWLENLGIGKMNHYFTITFDTSGGTPIPSQTIVEGEQSKKPNDPAKENHSFLYWYYFENTGSESNPNYQEIQFDFNTKITKDYFLYAKYDQEAIMTTAVSGGNKLFWEYRDKITSISFLKGSISIPETAKQFWNHIEANESCSQIAAFLEDDGSSETYKLTIISEKDIYANPNTNFYFYQFSNLESINFENFNTSKSHSMGSMFQGCKKLKQLDHFNFNTTNVTDMAQMFHSCATLTSLDVSSFNTKNVSNMYCMFYGCSNLESLDVKNFNTKNVTSMKYMFSGMSGITKLDISNFNTEKVTNMSYMFLNCKKIIDLNLKDFNTTQVTDMSYMFSECSSLQKLDLSSFNTNHVKNMDCMFSGCRSIHDLNINNFDLSNIENMTKMFNWCSNLNIEITIKSINKNTQYDKMFWCAATTNNSKIIVNYTIETEDFVDSIIATKASHSNVLKGNLIH